VIAILKTVNPATLNFAQAVLKEADIRQAMVDAGLGDELERW